MSDGPIVGNFLGTYYPLKRYVGAGTLPDGHVDPGAIDAAEFRSDYKKLFGQYRRVEGDTIWAGSIFWGIPWMEALTGCDVFADHETGSCRSIRPALPPSPESIPSFDDTSPWIRKAGEFLELLRTYHPTFPLGTTLMRGFSDILSALYGTPDFVYRLVDDGADLTEVLSKLSDLWIAFAEFQLDRFPDFHGGTGSYFYNLWMPGKGVWIQEDAAALLSPQIFEANILPALLKVIDRFDSVIIHLHPTQYIPIDSLLETDLAAIELHIDKGGPTAEELLPVYRKIQTRKPLVIWGDLTEADVACIRKKLDLTSLAVLPVIDSAEEADRHWKALKG